MTLNISGKDVKDCILVPGRFMNFETFRFADDVFLCFVLRQHFAIFDG